MLLIGGVVFSCLFIVDRIESLIKSNTTKTTTTQAEMNNRIVGGIKKKEKERYQESCEAKQAIKAPTGNILENVHQLRLTEISDQSHILEEEQMRAETSEIYQ